MNFNFLLRVPSSLFSFRFFAHPSTPSTSTTTPRPQHHMVQALYISNVPWGASRHELKEKFTSHNIAQMQPSSALSRPSNTSSLSHPHRLPTSRLPTHLLQTLVICSPRAQLIVHHHPHTQAPFPANRPGKDRSTLALYP